MTEILIASNLLLWAAVIGLGVGYFGLLRRSGTGGLHEHHSEDATAGLIGSRPELPPDVQRALGSDRTGLILIAPPGCAPCDRLRDELLRDGWTEPIPLILVTTSAAAGLSGAEAVLLTNDEAQELSVQLGVRDHPYAWFVHQGRLRVGGAVNTIGHLRQLLELASVAEAPTPQGEQQGRAG